MELIAHKEAAVARLTTSKTAAMNAPLFRVQGSSESTGGSIAYLKLALMARAAFERREDPRVKWGKDGVELFNISQAGAKCTALVYTMTISDFHKLFIGRMGEAGNEMEVREVVRLMANALHALYPAHILEPSEYLALGNGAKYVASAVPPLAGFHNMGATEIVADTVLTSAARRIFAGLHIDTRQSDAHQLAEFCSRVTYLAFPSQPPTNDSAVAYMRKLIFEKQHLSIAAACRLSVAIGETSAAQANSFQLLASSSGAEFIFNDVLVVSASLKVFHVLLGKLAQQDSDAMRELGARLHRVLRDRFPFIIQGSYEESKKRKLQDEGQSVRVHAT